MEERLSKLLKDIGIEFPDGVADYLVANGVIVQECTGSDPIKPEPVMLDRQCWSCGVPMGSRDNFCPNCGRKMGKK